MHEVTVIQAAGSRWELAERRVPKERCGAQPKIGGYDERSCGPVARTEFEPAHLVLILELGPALSVDGRPTRAGVPSPGGFAAGLGTRPTRTRHNGWQRGLELKLSPTTAYRLLGPKAVDWCAGIIALSDLVGATLVSEELQALPTWGDRFERLEGWIAERWQSGPRVDPRIEWAEGELRRRRGYIPIRALYQHLGLSERYFISLFRTYVGTSPKRFARELRLAHALEHIEAGEQPLAVIAATVGCSDQAHLSREIRDLAGCTATELRRQCQRGADSPRAP